MLLRIWKVHNGYASEISTDWHVGEHAAKTLQRRVDELAFSTSRAAPPFAIFERWGSMLRVGMGLHAALKRRSSTVLHSSCSFFTKSKINVNGVGQECPTHTRNSRFRKIPTALFFSMVR
jgi:hypothetical protein